eukprot:jgi/Ulvmu1/5481/UM023_0017.1
MASARYKDLICICVDVGGVAGESASDWADVLQRVIATRCINDKAHLEVSIIVYGSNATQNYLDSDSTYSGIDVVCEFLPADIKTFAALPRRVVAGRGESDFFSAFTVAADLLKRTTEDRKLAAARKSIVVASPFTTPIEPVPDNVVEQVFASFAESGPPTVSAAVSGWVQPKGAEEAAARAAARHCFETLYRAGAYGAVEVHASPRDLFSLVRAHAAPNMNQNVLKVDEFDVSVKTAKLTEEMTLAAFKPAAAGVPFHDSPFLVPSTRYHLKGQPEEERNADDKQQMFRFGEELFPALPDGEYKFQPGSLDEGFKGIQVVSFVHDSITPRPGGEDEEEEPEPEAAVPRWAVQDTLVAVLPATDLAAGALSALVRALRARHRMALVRYALTANAAVALGALVPVEGFRKDYPDHFVLCRVPWANDYRRLQMPLFENVAEDVAIQIEEMDAVADFVRARTDTASATLTTDRRCDPIRSHLAMEVAQQAIGISGGGGGDDGDAGESVDAFVAEVMLPGAQEDAATQAAVAAVLRLLPELEDTMSGGGAGGVEVGVMGGRAGG